MSGPPPDGMSWQVGGNGTYEYPVPVDDPAPSQCPDVGSLTIRRLPGVPAPSGVGAPGRGGPADRRADGWEPVKIPERVLPDRLHRRRAGGLRGRRLPGCLPAARPGFDRRVDRRRDPLRQPGDDALRSRNGAAGRAHRRAARSAAGALARGCSRETRRHCGVRRRPTECGRSSTSATRSPFLAGQPSARRAPTGAVGARRHLHAGERLLIAARGRMTMCSQLSAPSGSQSFRTSADLGRAGPLASCG